MSPVELTHLLLAAHGTRSLLEIGCGEGGIIAQFDCIQARVGVDWSEERLTLARSHHPDIRFDFGDLHDLLELYPAHAFDAVIGFDIFEHFEEPDSWHILSMAEQLARHFVVAFGPLGEAGRIEYAPEPGIDGHGMAHLCALEESLWSAHGYATMVFPAYWARTFHSHWTADAMLAIKEVGQ